jgi:phosphatidate cytidylyltransferase
VAAAVRWALGLGLLWLAWLALAQARTIGINFLLSVLCVVWVADIGGLLWWPRLRRRKLAPTISPGKSWEGVVRRHGRRAAAGAGLDRAGPQLDLGSASLFKLLQQGLGPGGLLLAALL